MGGPAFVNGHTVPELDNFYKCLIMYDGISYTSSEMVYQSMKSDDKEYKKKLSEEQDNYLMYRMGQDVSLPEDWEEKKYDCMRIANELKIYQNTGMIGILLDTYPHEIKFHGSTSYWNEMNAKILTNIRNRILKKYKT
jgi:predicted NAD-dependent protein-ADP-ribosyltransferase YbiA (DUF1768 family)